MKKILIPLLLALPLAPVSAHGPGHTHHRGEEEAAPPRHSHSFKDKTFAPMEESRWWSASLATGWESRHVHYGVDETGATGAYTTELSLQVYGLTLSVWSGFGTGNDYQEWDFTASYFADLGPLFVIPGYNFRYTPSTAHNHDPSESEHHHEHDHHGDHDHHAEHHHPSHGHSHGHVHKKYGHEIFLIVGTDVIPYVTPSAMALMDVANTPGTILEFRLDGELPIIKNTLFLNPYSLLAINLGYNGRDNIGWNNFQFGAEAEWRINRHLSLFGGVHYSVAMTALRDIDQDNVFWANAGVRLAY